MSQSDNHLIVIYSQHRLRGVRSELEGNLQAFVISHSSDILRHDIHLTI